MSDTKMYRFNTEALDAIRELRRLFRREMGRDPDPGDPCGFDPDLNEPQPEAEARIKSFMGDIADAAGLAPDLAYAIRKTGLLVTKNNQDGLEENQRAAWKEALAEYETHKRTS